MILDMDVYAANADQYSLSIEKMHVFQDVQIQIQDIVWWDAQIVNIVHLLMSVLNFLHKMSEKILKKDYHRWKNDK